MSKNSDQKLLDAFLQKHPSVRLIKNPQVKLPAKATVPLKRLSSSDIALKKFLLKYPSVKLHSAQIPLTSPLKKDQSHVALDDIKSEIDRQKQKIKKRILKDIYYNAAHPAGFGSIEKLFSAAQKRDRSFTREEIENWLLKQRSHYLSKTVKKFPRRKVLVRGIKHQYQADLMDFSAIANYNNHCKYVLTVIDCFSRKAFAKALRSKKGHVLKRALEEAFTVLGTPKKLQTDQGSEFFNQDVKQMLREKGVAHFFTHQELKAQMVERFNRTLRTKIAKFIFAKDNLRFAPHLQDFIASYNNAIHSALKKYSPNNVNKSNEDEVRNILYKEYFAKKKDSHKFQIGDKVRPIIKRDRYKKMEKQFREDEYIITDQVPSFPPTYQLKNSNDTAVKGVFYEKQLQKVV